MSHLKLPASPRVQSIRLVRADAAFTGYFASVGIAAYPALRAQVEAILHPAELEYFRPLPAEGRRTSFLLGRYAAKCALLPRLGPVNLSSIKIEFGVFKNPIVCFPLAEPCHVSITHSDTLACALAFPAAHPMALDVERIDAARTRVMATQCLEGERRKLAAIGLTEDAACTVLWTAKEAVSKALGTGMMTPFELFEVQGVESLGGGQYRGLYKAIGQYQFRSWILGDNVLTIALPKNTQMEFDAGGPALIHAADPKP